MNYLSPTDLIVYAEMIPSKLPLSKAQELRKKLEELKKNGDWVVEPPLAPAPKLWERLKSVRSEREIKQVASAISRWEMRHGLGYTGNPNYDFPRALRHHGRALLEAKRLPEYPKSKRPLSDDKRIWFFAKVLAGLMLGRTPLYTLKRLSRWRVEKLPELKGVKQ